MAKGSDCSVPATSSAPPSPGPETAAEPRAPVSAADSLASMCQRIQEARVNEELARFIASSIRESSHKTYRSVWKSLGEWCEANDMDCLSVSVTFLISYLQYLLREKSRASSNISVHRATISTISDALNVCLSESPLLRCFMKAVFLEHLVACVSQHETWDVGKVLNHLKSWGPIASLSLWQLAWRMFALLSFFQVDGLVICLFFVWILPIVFSHKNQCLSNFYVV